MNDMTAVQELAATLGKEASFDQSGTTIVLTAEDYYANAPEILTEEQLKAANAYNVIFTASSGLLLGTLANDAFKEDETVDEYGLICDMGHAVIEHTVQRNFEYGDEMHSNYLVTSYEVYARGDQDVLAMVAAQVASLASDASVNDDDEDGE